MLGGLLFPHDSDEAEVEFLSSLFPSAYRQQIRRIWRSENNWPMRIFLIGSLMVLLASSTSLTSRPDWFGHEARVGHTTSADVAHRWAQMGFCSDGSTGARCSHCDAHSDSLEADPANWHLNRRPGCLLSRLHRILSARDVPSFAEIAPDAMRFKEMIKDLYAALKDPFTRFVESFGFSSAAVASAMLAFHVARGSGRKTPRPGDLIGIINEDQSRSHDMFGRLLSMSRRLIDNLLPTSSPRDNTPLPIDSFPFRRSDSSHFGGTADRLNQSSNSQRLLDQLTQQQPNRGPTQTPTRSPPRPTTSPVSSHQKGTQLQRPSRISTPRPSTSCSVPEAESGKETANCIVCHLRPRDRVLLPCAHFIACHVCLQDRTSCPRCGGNILSMVNAYID